MEQIPQEMKKLIDKFNSIRGKPKEELGLPFWDLVVLTASDEAQREAYQLQVEDKLRRGQLPTGLPYLVYADPPGPKVGCGASTMYVITRLEERFGRELLNRWKVLLLNAGGQSQRLPSASVLGKIFTALPIEGYQMLDLKLAVYLPFLERMSPGYFHPASDCIEVYAMDPEDQWNFTEPGITALAHPSSLNIGTGHGVYVLENTNQASGGKQKTEFRNCLKVLQKPSIQLMRDEGAVLQDDEQNEFVYTDSLFFFDHDIGTKLAEFYRKESPINCEIDSYGDFLQPLGPRASIDYTLNTANVSRVEKNLVEMRQKVFHLLKGTPLHIVGLNISKFYHYGTFDEYLYHFTQDKIMQAELCMEPIVNSCLTGKEEGNGVGENANGRCKESGEPQEKVAKLSNNVPEGCIMRSLLPKASTIPLNSIVEFSHFSVPVVMGNNCVISNCQYTSGNLKGLSIPAKTFLHTVAVKIDSERLYVTAVFSIADNLKKGSLLQDVANLQYMGKPLKKVAEGLGIGLKSDVFPTKVDGDKCSLWEAKLFPAVKTMSSSLEAALEMVSMIQNADSGGQFENKTLFSIADVLKSKDVTGMLTYRSTLADEIHKMSC